jgi:arsenate reductase (thioredoxin)
MKTVLFACVHNAGRSQMAAAFFNAAADPSKARALSAGTEPDAHVHPEVVEVMREVGFDLSSRRPARLTEGLARDASLLVTMGCGEACPLVPGLERQDWPLQDPLRQPPERVREIRDEVRRRVDELLRINAWQR